nr:immunoglobulin light chain junction region [Macaca mulatta]MOV35388.1 immunoglobulin light chain junction region [Macaca mulatta]
CQHYNNLPFTF